MSDQTENKATGGQTVYDPATGKVIGTTMAPAPPGPTPEERILAGFKQQAAAYRSAVEAAITNMTGLAREARTTLDKASAWDFKAQMAAEEKVAALHVKFKAAKDELKKVQKFPMDAYPEHKVFMQSRGRFINELEKHFTERPPFSFHRF